VRAFCLHLLAMLSISADNISLAHAGLVVPHCRTNARLNEPLVGAGVGAVTGAGDGAMVGAGVGAMVGAGVAPPPAAFVFGADGKRRSGDLGLARGITSDVTTVDCLFTPLAISKTCHLGTTARGDRAGSVGNIELGGHTLHESSPVCWL